LIPVIAAGLVSFSLFSFSLFNAGAVNFDKLKPGSVPPNWTLTSAGPADPARWEIVFDKTAPSRGNVFAELSGVARDAESPLAVYDKVICRDGDLSVKFKIVPNTRRVKAAGIVWRYQDRQNYYLLEFSVDQRSIVLYRVQNGQMHPVPVLHGRTGDVGLSHDLRTGQWYETKVVFRGDHFKVLFDNRELFYAVDDSMQAPGKTGLWTRGGTVASFDDYRIDRKG
jgi:hypothetical protein